MVSEIDRAVVLRLDADMGRILPSLGSHYGFEAALSVAETL